MRHLLCQPQVSVVCVTKLVFVWLTTPAEQNDAEDDSHGDQCHVDVVTMAMDAEAHVPVTRTWGTLNTCVMLTM